MAVRFLMPQLTRASPRAQDSANSSRPRAPRCSPGRSVHLAMLKATRSPMRAIPEIRKPTPLEDAPEAQELPAAGMTGSGSTEQPTSATGAPSRADTRGDAEAAACEVGSELALNRKGKREHDEARLSSTATRTSSTPPLPRTPSPTRFDEPRLSRPGLSPGRALPAAPGRSVLTVRSNSHFKTHKRTIHY